jgi:exodeoxyribonuclease V alpha subunit
MFASPAILPRLVASTLFTEADLYQARFAASLAREGHADLVAGLTALASLAVREGHVCLHLGDEDVRKRLAALGLDGIGRLPGHGGDRRARFRAAAHPRREAPVFLPLLPRRRGPGPRLPAPGRRAAPGHPSRPAARHLQEPGRRNRLAGRGLLRGPAQPFCVISGGPGTGKTTTVARILLWRPACTPARIFASAWPRPRARRPRA